MVHITPTLSDVDTYLETYYVTDDAKRIGWDELSQSDKAVYLNRANAAISILKGLKYDETFSMNAQIEEALELAAPGEDTKRWEQRHVQSYSLGSLSESFRSVGALQELRSSMAQAWVKRMTGGGYLVK